MLASSVTALAHISEHAIVKSMCFIGFGSIIHGQSSQDVRSVDSVSVGCTSYLAIVAYGVVSLSGGAGSAMGISKKAAVSAVVDGIGHV